ncbi:MAG: cyanophycinase [Propionibacteriales bacterium]|nr:cyanophycinase [Propionibacteriales bacterium]
MDEGAQQVGPLYVIGGAEDKLKRRTVLRHFVTACGGETARIAVVPTASSLGPEVVDIYAALFSRLGAAEVIGVRPQSREDASDDAFVSRLDDVTGIFLTGGNQLKLSAILNGTPFGDAVTAAHVRGVVVGGTSAGASIQSTHMVAFGTGGATPKQRMTQLAAGLGLVKDCVIDQHFAQRNRYGRLLMLVAQSPNLLGIGVDEDTAAIIRDDRELEVIGRGAVTLIDGLGMTSDAHEAKRTAPLLVSGARLHVLPAGARFDLVTRNLVPTGRDADSAEATELRVAGADVRRLAEDIAAEGVPPSHRRQRLAPTSSEAEEAAR